MFWEGVYRLYKIAKGVLKIFPPQGKNINVDVLILMKKRKGSLGHSFTMFKYFLKMICMFVNIKNIWEQSLLTSGENHYSWHVPKCS